MKYPPSLGPILNPPANFLEKEASTANDFSLKEEESLGGKEYVEGKEYYEKY